MSIDKKYSACHDCVFVKYKKKQQSGCKAGKVDNYIDKVLIQAKNKRTAYIGKPICTHYRNKNWEHKDKPVDEMITLARKEIEIKYSPIILSDGDMQKLQLTLNSVYDQVIGPQIVRIYIKNKGEDPKEVISAVRGMVKGQWELVFLQEDIDLNEVVKVHIPKNQDPFMIFVDAGTELDHNLMLNIDNSIHDNRQEFMFLNANCENQGLFFPRAAYKYLFPMPVSEILTTYSEGQPNITDFGNIWKRQ